MSRLHLTNGLIGLLSVILGFISKSFYRSYAYQNKLSDLGLSDWAPSFFYVLGFSQLMLIKKYRYPWLVILIITAASILYEFMQAGNQMLDAKDIFASAVGGIISFLLLKLRHS